MEITSVVDVQRLLDTIYPDPPCGDDLEYDAAFLELECAAQGQPEEFLTRMLEGKPLAGVRISQRDNALHYVFETAD